MYIYKHIYMYSCPLYIYLYIYIHVYLHTGSLMYMCACGSRRTEEKEDRLVAYHSLSLNLCPTHSSHTLLHTDNPQAQSTENTSPQKTPTNKTQHIQKTQDTHTQKRHTQSTRATVARRRAVVALPVAAVMDDKISNLNFPLPSLLHELIPPLSSDCQSRNS